MIRKMRRIKKIMKLKIKNIIIDCYYDTVAASTGMINGRFYIFVSVALILLTTGIMTLDRVIISLSSAFSSITIKPLMQIYT